jgi:hypothetical protein
MDHVVTMTQFDDLPVSFTGDLKRTVGHYQKVIDVNWPVSR